ncbi:MAG: hypothetical protein MASP_00512 [Candidatus Methanolliviera sp. GoM_asphalt]|nr:MAG: hypothetical protein MASP_00512 [Candidatus Methanolliviera sp. GoM_asphalt]
MINEIDGTVLLIITAGFFAILLAVIVQGTLRKTKWGITLKGVCCPRCGEKSSFIRKPTSRQQFLWGGWTCPKCGCEVDKWGREVEKLDKKESDKK